MRDPKWFGLPRSQYPYAPVLGWSQYYYEQASFFGGHISAMLYGISAYLSVCPCLPRLFDLNSRDCHRTVLPVHGRVVQPLQSRNSGHQMGLGAYTVAMFSFVTIATAMNLNLLDLLLHYISRTLRGLSVTLLTAHIHNYSPRRPAPNILFFLNSCLADGILVGPESKSVAQMSYASRPCSSIVATSFTP
jgi:hypothetical protein